MSIRIHELAKRYNMEGKDLLALLKERGYVAADTKSVSSTVSKIYVEEIEKELGSRVAAKPEPAHAAAAAGHPAAVAEPAVTAGVAPENAQVRIPSSVRVKTADDIAREREQAAAAKAAAAAASNPAPAPIARPAPPVSRPPTLPPRAPVPTASAPKPPPAPPAPRAAIPGVRPSAEGPRTSASAAPVAPTASAPAAPASAPAARPSVSAPARIEAPPPAPAPVQPKAAASPPPLPVSAPRPPPARPPAAPAAPVSTVTVEGDVKIIHFKPPVIVRDFAIALGLKPFQLISELLQMGHFASITQSLEEGVAGKIAEKHGFLLEVKHRGDVAAQQQAQKDRAAKKTQPEEDQSANLVPRPPVVCILGHVDHGKTSLLDAIRKAHVAEGEAGGITQHIGAYQIEFNQRRITFLDTPGHAAFNQMRARGASVTDIAVLVVAADDGFMPQTDEALAHVQNAKVALIVAVNKMDVKGANLDQVKAQMQQRGIAPEDWGGETITVPVSAVKGTGVNELLEMILLQADVLELKANPKAEAAGVVIESQVDVGRGPLATVIIQRGTLRVGDALVSGPYWAKVRAMFDDQGGPLKEAPPSTPVRIIGWSGTPESGAQVRAVKNAREAENLAEEEQQRLRQVAGAAGPKEVSVEQLFANIAATQARVLKVIVKTDVYGSAEAVRNVLEGIKSTKVQLEIVSAEVGLVTKNDVLMASAAGATILGFNTKLENGVTPLAKHHGVRIETFGIIYELGDRVREMMADLLEPDLKEIKLGAAEVRAVFPLAKGFVAGCLVTEGRITRGATSRLRRGRENVHEGRVATLKRFKDDANEVRAGLECGIKLDDFNGYQVGDVIECFEVQKVRASL
ncbi:MAG TPA: translation initiation factor IF-2 [Opitutaceae bacterium]|jgi:translation initiation factor IF-2|nr:translation initiation factor IF-2 [Opitutaceae bacterium]